MRRARSLRIVAPLLLAACAAQLAEHGSSDIAIHGVDFAMRTPGTLARSAVKFIGKHEGGDTAFVKNEAEALRWIAGRRAAATVRDST